MQTDKVPKKVIAAMTLVIFNVMLFGALTAVSTALFVSVSDKPAYVFAPCLFITLLVIGYFDYKKQVHEIWDWAMQHAEGKFSDKPETIDDTLKAAASKNILDD